MSIQELEDEALKLPEDERTRLAQRLLASVGHGLRAQDDPILGLGSAPVSCGTPDGSANHDAYLYEQPGR